MKRLSSLSRSLLLRSRAVKAATAAAGVVACVHQGGAAAAFSREDVVSNRNDDVKRQFLIPARDCLRAHRRRLQGSHLIGGWGWWSFLTAPSRQRRVFPSSSSSSIALCEAARHGDGGGFVDSAPSSRTYNTQADLYYQQHGELPEPPIRHATLAKPPQRREDDERRHGILVIGDVHGCYEEMIELHRVAEHNNNGRPFLYVILVGDLCNKGPDSARVIRHVRGLCCDSASSSAAALKKDASFAAATTATQGKINSSSPHDETTIWLSIRGNHDNGALTAALGDEVRRKKRRYQWVGDLSDDDVQWMADLPYTIRIPCAFFGEQESADPDSLDTVIVHAGLVPGVPLEDQTIETMITVRTVVPHDGGSGGGGSLIPWAQAWSRQSRPPFSVVFGHDARRALQLEDHATGLDTGCCYGKQLSGWILPSRTLVQVPAKAVHCPVD